MVIVDVKYDEYALVHIFTARGESPTVVNKLYGKVIPNHDLQISQM